MKPLPLQNIRMAIFALLVSGGMLPMVKAGEQVANKVALLGDALAASNAQLEEVTLERNRLKLQIESLGLAALKGDSRSLQERLLKAVAALSLSEKQRQELLESTARLAEAAAAASSAPNDSSAQSHLAGSLKEINGVVASQKAAEMPVALANARVISIKSELGLAVANVGSQSGVRIGMPILIQRNGNQVGTGIVVDVRDRITGVLLTNGDTDVRTGDALLPETSSNTSSTHSSTK